MDENEKRAQRDTYFLAALVGVCSALLTPGCIPSQTAVEQIATTARRLADAAVKEMEP